MEGASGKRKETKYLSDFPPSQDFIGIVWIDPCITAIKILDPIGILDVGALQRLCDKLIPARQVLTREKALWDRVISITPYPARTPGAPRKTDGSKPVELTFIRYFSKSDLTQGEFIVEGHVRSETHARLSPKNAVSHQHSPF